MRRYRLHRLGRLSVNFEASSHEEARIEAFDILRISRFVNSTNHEQAFREAGGKKIELLPDGTQVYPSQPN